jgi:hypothetical protein
MKIADERHRHTHPVELIANVRNGGSGFGRVHRDPHQFRPGLSQFLHLDCRADGVGSVGIGHRLDSHGRVAADGHKLASPADVDRMRCTPLPRSAEDGLGRTNLATDKGLLSFGLHRKTLCAAGQCTVTRIWT